MTTIIIRETRTFSIGYSSEETRRLMSETAIVTSYNVYPKGIVKDVQGTKHIMGAYDGYNIATIVVDGVKLTYDEFYVTMDALRKAYRTQSSEDITRVSQVCDAAKVRSLNY